MNTEKPIVIPRLCTTFVLLLLMAAPVSAGSVYKTVDEEGNVSYTDNPPSEGDRAEPVDLPAINTQPALEVKLKPKEQPPKETGYKEVSILSPAQDATIPPGQRNVVVQVFLEPALKPSHRVQLLHNGNPHGQPAFATSFTIDELIRGMHTLQAQVVDESDAVVASSQTVTIHVKRASRLNNPGKQGPLN